VGEPSHSGEPFLCVFPGQWTVVSLPAGQQQVLDRIESDLEAGEPRLRSMFAIFTRLTRDEVVPRTESLRPKGLLRRAWQGYVCSGPLRAVIYVPLVLGLVALFVFLAINSSAGHGCRPVAEPHVGASARAASCQSVLEQHGRY
jgi:hypothetical protein